MSGDWCPIGSLHLHTMNYEKTECIWCGPNALAWKPGHWVDIGGGFTAWSAALTASSSPASSGTSAEGAE